MQAIAMRKKDAALPAYRNFFSFEEATLLDGLRRGALYSPYKQKVQYPDRQTLYLATSTFFTGNTNSSLYIAIANSKGEIIDEPDIFTELTSVPYTYTSGDITEETDVFVYRWRYAAGDYPEGDYYIYIKVTYDSGNIEEFISEPQWVATKHKRTALLSYTCNTDKEDILFGTLGISFNKRIDSDYMKLVPKGEETTYKEQNEELRRLYGKYYRAFEFYIKRAPEYEIDILGRILLNATALSIENKRFVKEEGAEIEYERNNNSVIGSGKVTLREYYGDRAGLHINEKIVVLTRPGTYPYMVPGFHLFNDITYGMQDGIEIEDATFETNWVANDLNLDMIDDMDSGGSFAWEGDDLVFTNAPGEYFRLSYSVPVMPYYWEFTIGSFVTGSGVQFSYIPYGAGWSGYAVFVDTVKELRPLISSDSVFGDVENYEFSSNGTKTVRVYNTGNMKRFIWGTQPQGQTGKVTTVTGTDADGARLEEWSVFRQNIAGTFDPFARVQNSAFNIRYINISGNGITSITTSGLTAQANQWKLLNQLQLASNAMNSTALDNFIIAFEADSGYLYGGSMYIKQIPTALPTGASSAARTAMLGWSFIS